MHSRPKGMEPVESQLFISKEFMVDLLETIWWIVFVAFWNTSFKFLPEEGICVFQCWREHLSAEMHRAMEKLHIIHAAAPATQHLWRSFRAEKCLPGSCRDQSCFLQVALLASDAFRHFHLWLFIGKLRSSLNQSNLCWLLGSSGKGFLFLSSSLCQCYLALQSQWHSWSFTTRFPLGGYDIMLRMTSTGMVNRLTGWCSLTYFPCIFCYLE